MPAPKSSKCQASKLRAGCQGASFMPAMHSNNTAQMMSKLTKSSVIDSHVPSLKAQSGIFVWMFY